MVNLRWSFANWITVLLMVGIGYVAFGLVRSAIVSNGGGASDAAA